MTKPVIGFIGLGLMGGNMVENLQTKGFEVVVMDLNKEVVANVIARGNATEAKTGAELAAASDIVMLCLTTSVVVEKLVYGENGILAGIKKGSVLVDFGTSIPASTKTLAAECKAKGASMMDAPLGRTPASAVDGLLNIMSAGDQADFDRMKPVFEDLGENVFHVGPIGAGHTLKLINNFYGMTTACAMSEAFAMADLAGLERKTLYDVMSSGPLNSGMMGFIKEGAVDGMPEKMAFSIANSLKDVGYYSKMADDFKVPSFISPAVKNTLGLAEATGYGEKMVPEMVDFIAGVFAKK